MTDSVCPTCGGSGRVAVVAVPLGGYDGPADAVECPECGGEGRKEGGGKMVCSNCEELAGLGERELAAMNKGLDGVERGGVE